MKFIKCKNIEGGIFNMKINLGIGAWFLIAVIVFIKRYLTGMDLSDIGVWIGIGITSFFWFIGISLAIFIGSILILYIVNR